MYLTINNYVICFEPYFFFLFNQEYLGNLLHVLTFM